MSAFWFFASTLHLRALVTNLTILCVGSEKNVVEMVTMLIYKDTLGSISKIPQADFGHRLWTGLQEQEKFCPTSDTHCKLRKWGHSDLMSH